MSTGCISPVKDFNVTLGGERIKRYAKLQRHNGDVAGVLRRATGYDHALLNESRSSDNFSYRAGVDYHFSPEVMVYASVRRPGYKTGVFLERPFRPGRLGIHPTRAGHDLRKGASRREPSTTGSRSTERSITPAMTIVRRLWHCFRLSELRRPLETCQKPRQLVVTRTRRSAF